MKNFFRSCFESFCSAYRGFKTRAFWRYAAIFIVCLMVMIVITTHPGLCALLGHSRTLGFIIGGLIGWNIMGFIMAADKTTTKYIKD